MRAWGGRGGLGRRASTPPLPLSKPSSSRLHKREILYYIILYYIILYYIILYYIILYYTRPPADPAGGSRRGPRPSRPPRCRRAAPAAAARAGGGLCTSCAREWNGIIHNRTVRYIALLICLYCTLKFLRAAPVAEGEHYISCNAHIIQCHITSYDTPYYITIVHKRIDREKLIA